MLTLQGVVVACPLAFVIPPVCVMKLRQEPLLSRGNVLPILVSVFGALVFLVGTTMAIINLSDGILCSHGKEMEYCSDAFSSTSIFRNATNSTMT